MRGAVAPGFHTRKGQVMEDQGLGRRATVDLGGKSNRTQRAVRGQVRVAEDAAIHAGECLRNEKGTDECLDVDLRYNPHRKQYIGTKTIHAWPEVRGGQFGYTVEYSDGYLSWSPKAVFEEAYHSPETARFDFGTAVSLLKQGYCVTREGWNGKGMYLALQTPDEYSKMRRPYIFMSPVGGEFVPWVASQSDILSEDWILFG